MCQVYRCVLLFVCAAVVVAKFDESLLTDDLKKLMNTLHKTCVDQTGVDEAHVDALKKGEFNDNDEKLKCYVKCVLTESGAMDENSEIDLASLGELVPEKVKDNVKQEFKTCTSKGDGIVDHCEKAYVIIKCVHDEDPETFFFA